MTAVVENPSNPGLQLIDTPSIFEADCSACLLTQQYTYNHMGCQSHTGTSLVKHLIGVLGSVPQSVSHAVLTYCT